MLFVIILSCEFMEPLCWRTWTVYYFKSQSYQIICAACSFRRLPNIYEFRVALIGSLLLSFSFILLELYIPHLFLSLKQNLLFVALLEGQRKRHITL